MVPMENYPRQIFIV